MNFFPPENLPVNRTLRIDLLSPRMAMVVLPPPPPGVKMSGLRSDPANGPSSNSLFVIVEITRDVSVAVLAHWIWKRIEQYNAKRKSVKGHEVVDESGLERIISEDLEIGKND
jgi:hypothetical protein